MGVDKKYALLDTDFLYKSHIARNAANHTLTDFVMEFTDYEFFCHEMIKEELNNRTWKNIWHICNKHVSNIVTDKL